MSIKIGVNAWIWTSPFTTSDPESLALLDKAKKMGFETFEFGLEDVSHRRSPRLVVHADHRGGWPQPRGAIRCPTTGIQSLDAPAGRRSCAHP